MDVSGSMRGRVWVATRSRWMSGDGCECGSSTFGSDCHGDPAIGDGGIDVHLAGNDAEAKGTVADIARSAGFQPVDVGPLLLPALKLEAIWRPWPACRAR
jgi:hypothetical protein